VAVQQSEYEARYDVRTYESVQAAPVSGIPRVIQSNGRTTVCAALGAQAAGRVINSV